MRDMGDSEGTRTRREDALDEQLVRLSALKHPSGHLYCDMGESEDTRLWAPILGGVLAVACLPMAGGV